MKQAAPKIIVGKSLQKDLLARDMQRRSSLSRLHKTALSNVVPRNDLLPRLRLDDRAPGLLRMPKRNVRMVDPGHVREIANSITALGFTVPVLIDGEGTIVDGVARFEAAKLLGLATVPCVVVDHLTPSERKLLRLAANRLGEKGSWSFDELKLELKDLIIDDAPIEISGFEIAELDGILSECPEPLERGPLAPLPRPAVSRIGDVFCCGPHKILCGDATDRETIRRLMQDKEAQLVFTDEPYNVPISGHVTSGKHREFEMASGEMTEAEFQAFNIAWIEGAKNHLADGGLLATFIDWRGLMSVSTAALHAGLTQVNLVVWSKTNAGMGSLYRSQHETLPLFKKGNAPHVNNVKLGRSGRWRSNVWPYAGASSIGSEARKGLVEHPTVKPTAMLVDAMLDLTERDDIVLDPFLGSGSTLIAAEKAGRVCYGVEIDPLYVDVILRRYEAETGRSAILEETGETFEALDRCRQAEPVADFPAETPPSLNLEKLSANGAPTPQPCRIRTRSATID